MGEGDEAALLKRVVRSFNARFEHTDLSLLERKPIPDLERTLIDAVISVIQEGV